MKKQINEPNYTQIPNIILDSMAEFSHVEFKVVMLICRHEGKEISISEMIKKAKISRAALVKSLKNLTENNFVRRIKSSNSFRYQPIF